MESNVGTRISSQRRPGQSSRARGGLTAEFPRPRFAESELRSHDSDSQSHQGCDATKYNRLSIHNR